VGTNAGASRLSLETVINYSRNICGGEISIFGRVLGMKCWEFMLREGLKLMLEDWRGRARAVFSGVYYGVYIYSRINF